MDEGNKANLIDSLNLLWSLVIFLDYDKVDEAKQRIKEYGYIANTDRIMKLLDFVNEQ